MSKLILVVEDQEDNMQILRDLLASAGYEMIEAENGEIALAALAKQRPDLILMDIQLPIMDGYEATRRIKADPVLKSIPVIAVTSYALSGDEQKARDAGCGASTFATDETCQIPPRAVRIPRWFNCSAIATMPTRPWARMLRITLIAKRPASAC
jgi:two-component system cell cycle response regulator DivK